MNLITPFDPWKSKLCTCPPKYSLSAYTGCGHGCLYCYASSYIRDFARPREKKDFLKRLIKEVSKINRGSTITLAYSSDPYLPLEQKLKLTRQALKILKKFNFKIIITTKSSLIIKDIDIIKELNIVVCFSITTLNKTLALKLEPHASLPKERLKALEQLSKYVPTAVRFDPLIYPLNTSGIEKTIQKIKSTGIKQVITSTYKARPDNFQRMLRVFKEYETLWKKLYWQEGEKIRGYIYLSRFFREKLIQEVRQITLQEGLGFSSCREGFELFNTLSCDGSSLLT
ncbi:MAG: radical SAM protein [Candidatus Omnitrophica bacterium]|jgi:DNA repair photolyase|nr:radical SAM protein [Candidatus Omnitrophota bacterium]